MARRKEYIEADVIDKAMNLFWRNGYQSTSMHMLEKEMGINKFSIYASFGNKNGVFLKSLHAYKLKLNTLINKLKTSKNGVEGIKQYFYDFIEFSKETEFGKGCLVTNTANEIGDDADDKIKEALAVFTNEVKQAFASILQQNQSKTKATIEEEADYLIISMFGLSSATRVFNTMQLHHYIENIFKRL